MDSENSSEPPKPENNTQEFDELARCIAAQIRGALIEEHVQTGSSRTTAENLIDFVWTRRGWPLVCDEQLRNIRRWSLN